MGCVGVDFIDLAQNTVQCDAFMKNIMKHKSREFLGQLNKCQCFKKVHRGLTI